MKWREVPGDLEGKGLGSFLSGGVPLSSGPSGGNGAEILRSNISVTPHSLRAGSDAE